MKIKTLFICFILFVSSVCSASIKKHLNTDITHCAASGLKSVDAVFLLSFNQNDDLSDLIEQFKNYGIETNVYQKFTTQNISQKLIAHYCTENLSPYLLVETLSHLSIYKYCIENGIKNALIVESKAEIKQSPEVLRYALKDLSHCDHSWDVLYTDVDYHNPKNGEYLTPKENKKINDKPLKRQVNSSLSRVFRRYAITSYIISETGMKKVLNAYERTWRDLPYDQAILKVRGIRCYGVHQDIITNSYLDSVKNAVSKVKEEICFERNNYPVGKEFWLDPKELLHASRFDVIAKYIYAKYYLNSYATSWAEDLYKDHIGKWNSFYEGSPLKIGYQQFRDEFYELIESLKANGYASNADPVPINNQGTILNGSHRVGACLALNIPVRVKVEQTSSMTKHNSFAFLMRRSHKTQEKYLDFMATEYAKLKKNTFVACLFPVAYPYYEVAEKVLSKYGDIVFSKDIHFTESGALELIRLLYLGEGWVGNYENNYKQGRVKTQLCFPSETFGRYPARVYLFECKDVQTAKKAKLEIRDILHMGNDAIHVNDTHAQTVTIASSLFNENSIYFMNHRRLAAVPNFDRLFSQFRSFVQENHLNYNLLCVDASAILSAYGLRDCQDIDILHKGALPKDTKGEITSHNGYLKYHAEELDNILFNPDNYFYFQGVKFLSINLLKKMKTNRNETKDVKDIKLIDSL
jgi:GR25 family glycosyltransferase involved in LPS biosynthesis